MTDVARLTYGIDSRPAAGAADDLDRMTAAAKRAEDQAMKTGGASSAAADRAQAGMLRMLTAIERTTREIAVLIRGHGDFVRGLAEGAAAALREANALEGVAVATQHASATNSNYAVSMRSVTATVDGAAASLRNYSSGVDRAAAQTAEAGKQAAVATHHFDTMYDEFQRDFVGQYVAGMKRVEAAHTGVAASSRKVTLATLGLSRQFADIAVTGAMGMNPFMIFLQQGPQVADQLALMKIEGVSLSAAMRQLAASTWAALAPLAPFLIAAAALAVVIGGTLALATRSLNKEHKDFAKSLGLTADQLERVKEKGITMGDVLKGTFNYLGKAAAPVLKPVADFFSKLFDDITKGAVLTVKGMLGLFLGAFDAIQATWKQLPAAIADAMISAVNLSITGIEKLVNAAIALINKLRPAINALAMVTGTPVQLAEIQPVQIERLKNGYAGAMRDVGQAAKKGFTEGWERGGKLVDEQIAALKKSITDAAAARIRKEAGKAGASAATPRDLTDERAAQIAAMVAQAKADELQAQIGLSHDVMERARLEKEVLAQELAVKQAGVVRQAANIAYDVEKKRLSAASGAELIGQLEIVKETNARVAAAKARAIDDAAIDAVARQALDLANAKREAEVTVLGFQRDSARTAAERGLIDLRLLELADERARAEAQAVITAKGSNQTQIAIANEQLKTLKATKADRENRIRQDTAIAGSEEILRELHMIDDLASSAGQSLEQAFGRAGGAVGGLVTALSGLRVELEEIGRLRLENQRDPQRGITEAQAERARAAAQIRTYGDLAQAAQGFFKTGSAGYKALQTAEMGFRAIQFANAVRAMFLEKAETGQTLIQNALKATSHGIVAVARAIASMPFPLNLAAGAATAAALVAFGVKLSGSGGGGGGAVSAEERQKAQGTGTVLGAAAAKSESIAKSLVLVAANTNRDLEYSNGMLRALRSIDSNIGSLTAALARQLGVGGAFDTSGLGLGTTRSGPSTLTKLLAPIAAVFPGLFGKTVTTTLLDQGVTFDAQSLNDILAGGLSGDSYQDIQTKTKKKFLGVSYSNKTKVSTQTTPLEDDILAEMQRVIASLRTGVLSAAGVLGVEGAQAALDAFTVDLGTISFKDKTGAEIQEELNAVFGKLGDQLTEAVLGNIAEFQKAGEGAFETLVRLARQYQVIDVTLQSIGKTFGAVGVASLEARQHLVDLFGSLDDFVEQTSFFAENFLTEAERIAPIQAAVVKEFARLGVTGVNTIEQFKQLVLGLDLTTASGQEMYAALLAVAPAFKKVIDFLTDGSKDLTDARNELSKAYEREADALQDTIDKFDGFAKSLRAFRQSLDSGPNALLSPERQYLATRAAFEQTAAKARLGDETALADLQSVSQAYLDASRAYYASSGHYFQDLSAVKAAVTAAADTAARTADNATQQLAALRESVSALITINESVLSVHDAILALQAQMAAANAASGANATPFSPAANAAGSTVPGYALPPTSPTSTTAGGGFNASSYLTSNPDVAAEYARLMSSAEGQAYLASQHIAAATDFAKLHYDMFGMAEGRPGFATGGSFTVAGTGPKDFGPVTLHGGEVVKVSHGNDNSEVVAELKGLREEVGALRAQVAHGDQANVDATKQAGERTAQAVRQPTTEGLRAGGRAR